MTIINANPDNIIQLGWEGEDRVTVLRFRYGEDWVSNGDGVFSVRVLRNGENQAYNAQMVLDDSENHCLLVTLTAVELSKKGTNEMQVVYSGADFIKKSPVYRYYVSRSVDEPVDPPAEDVYTQIIESLSELQTDVQGLSDAVEDIGDISLLTTTAKTDLVSAINEVNAKGGTDITVDDALSDVSKNPVQNRVITEQIDFLADGVQGLQTSVQSKADTQTVSALADAVQDLDGDVQGLQTTVQSKADTATVTALSGTVSGLQTTVQSKADTSTVTALSGTVSALSDAAQQYMEHTEAALDNKADISAFDDLYGTVQGLQTSKADKSYVDTQLAEKASTQTVSDLSDDVSDLQTGLAGKVGDVQINGNSVVTDGVANVPVAGSNIVGVVKTEASQGLVVSNTGLLTISQASQNYIKSGTRNNNPITPIRQHESTFYGLAKVAGHDEKNSTLPVGQYSEEAKTAIRTMLGLQDVYEDYSSALDALGGGA